MSEPKREDYETTADWLRAIADAANERKRTKTEADKPPSP